MSITKPATVTCTACGAQVPRPADVQWRPLWDAGWRWIDSQDLCSCPACPPVIVVDEQGRHRSAQRIEGDAGH